ncbi:MAG: hypothetical protein JWQ72_3719 [Polaromonas sp.]|nr:hypothetical protein [Polaromonas sp.]
MLFATSAARRELASGGGEATEHEEGPGRREGQDIPEVAIAPVLPSGEVADVTGAEVRPVPPQPELGPATPPLSS